MVSGAGKKRATAIKLWKEGDDIESLFSKFEVLNAEQLKVRCVWAYIYLRFYSFMRGITFTYLYLSLLPSVQSQLGVLIDAYEHMQFKLDRQTVQTMRKNEDIRGTHAERSYSVPVNTRRTCLSIYRFIHFSILYFFPMYVLPSVEGLRG